MTFMRMPSFDDREISPDKRIRKKGHRRHDYLIRLNKYKAEYCKESAEWLASEDGLAWLQRMTRLGDPPLVPGEKAYELHYGKSTGLKLDEPRKPWYKRLMEWL